MRYELEKQLMDGALAVRELPGAWNAMMKETLGVDVPDDAHGVLQDIHWAGGDVGYFPSYALGSAYAAQIAACMRRSLDVNALLEAGDFAPINAWLCERIWRHGRALTPDALFANACGEAFDAQHYIRYLKEKYAEIYRL